MRTHKTLSVRVALLGVSLGLIVALAAGSPASASAAHARVSRMPTLKPRSSGAASASGNLSYRGGAGGVGVETAPKVYLVLWGSQWNNNDPSDEAGIVQSFLSGV